MFFSIGKKIDPRFVNHEAMGEWWFSHDSGWKSDSDSWFKGYDHAGIDHGNYCRITFVEGRITVDHDRYRSFPLWWNAEQQTLTNLLGDGEMIWSDRRVDLTSDGLNERKIDVYGEIDTSPLHLDDVLDLLSKNLEKKFHALQEDYSGIPKKLFVSGGVDTLLLLAASRNTKLDVDLLDYDYVEYDRFTDTNLWNIRRNHWAYGQIHHWRSGIMLLSGACGDEFMFRGPYTIGLWAAWNDINLGSLLDRSQGYHTEYFNRSKNRELLDNLWKDRKTLKDHYPTKEDLIKQILNVNVNDYQHWHLGNTLTWTPFKDLELTKLILRLDESDLIDHIIDANVSRRLIERLDLRCSELVSPTKNKNSRQNLYRLFEYQ